MKNRKLVIIIVVLLLIIAIVFAYKKFKNKPVEQAPGMPAPSPAGPSAPTSNDNYPLIKGSNGENVKYLQQAINKIATKTGMTYGIVSVDGDFGPQTYNSLLIVVGASYYPVTQAKFTEILNKSNNL